MNSIRLTGVAPSPNWKTQCFSLSWFQQKKFQNLVWLRKCLLKFGHLIWVNFQKLTANFTFIHWNLWKIWKRAIENNGVHWCNQLTHGFGRQIWPSELHQRRTQSIRLTYCWICPDAAHFEFVEIDWLVSWCQYQISCPLSAVENYPGKRKHCHSIANKSILIEYIPHRLADQVDFDIWYIWIGCQRKSSHSRIANTWSIPTHSLLWFE